MPTERQVDIILESELEFKIFKDEQMSNEKYTTGYANAVIAKFMDFDVVDVGYADSEEETEWQRNHEEWMASVGLTQVGRYIVNVKENKWHQWDDVKYHSSWDQLKPVIDEIFKYALAYPQQVRRIIDMSVVVGISAAHEKVYQFIQWINKQSNTNDTANHD